MPQWVAKPLWCPVPTHGTMRCRCARLPTPLDPLGNSPQPMTSPWGFHKMGDPQVTIVFSIPSHVMTIEWFPWSNGAWGFHSFWSSKKWNWKSLYWLYLPMIIPCLTIPVDVSWCVIQLLALAAHLLLHPNHLPARAMLRASPKSKPRPPGFSFSASCQMPWRFQG